MLLRVSFEALASCFALLLIASELIYLIFLSPVKASGCPQTAAITLVYWFCASCCFELPANGRQFSSFCLLEDFATCPRLSIKDKFLEAY